MSDNATSKFMRRYGRLLRSMRTFQHRRLGRIYRSASRTGRNLKFMRKMKEVA